MSILLAWYLNEDTDNEHWQLIFSFFVELAAKHFF